MGNANAKRRVRVFNLRVQSILVSHNLQTSRAPSVSISTGAPHHRRLSTVSEHSAAPPRPPSPTGSRRSPSPVPLRRTSQRTPSPPPPPSRKPSSSSAYTPSQSAPTTAADTDAGAPQQESSALLLKLVENTNRIAHGQEAANKRLDKLEGQLTGARSSPQPKTGLFKEKRASNPHDDKKLDVSFSVDDYPCRELSSSVGCSQNTLVSAPQHHERR